MSYRLIFGYAVLATFALVLLVAVILLIRLVTLDTPSATAPKTNEATYVVKKGDSLSAISQKTGVTIDRIEQLNPELDPLSLLPGQRLKLKVTPAQKRGAQARRRKRRPSRYVVKPGDGLLGISQKTRVDQDRLRSLNRQHDLDKLMPGMRLRLRR
jgi:LysM repeat protein